MLLMLRKKYFIFLFFLGGVFLSSSSWAQLNVVSGVTANQLIQSMVGNGLTVSNVVINCDPQAYGTFSNGASTSLGMNNGILITTGNADSTVGPASNFANTCIGTSSNDPDLIALDPSANNDVCVLEFDILPVCDSLAIRFVFGSEEYPVFVNSFNDLFGFFISGLNPSGGNYTGLDIATLPSGQYVSINNVNNGNSNTGPCVNCAYYIDNTMGTTITYDGMTTVLTSIIGLVPCTSYHFKIAIADALDCVYDSGVFIDLMSCSSAFTSTSTTTPDMCGACNGSATVNVSGGNPPYAYQWLPSGGNTATANNLCAGTYSVLITDASSCGVPDTFLVAVPSQGSVALTTQQVSPLCFGDCNGSITVTPVGGVPPFTYTWIPNVSASGSATGLCAGTYSVSVADASGCSSSSSFVITQPPQLTLSLAGNNTICSGVSTTITATSGGGVGPYTVSWDNSLPNGNSQTVSPITTTTYNATVTDANGCSITQPFTVTVNSTPTAAFTPSPGTCPPALVSFTDNSIGGSTYSWNFGDPSSSSNTSTQQNPTHVYGQAGTYDVTLIVTSAAGCSDTSIINSAVFIPNFSAANFTVNDTVVSELTPSVVFTDLSSGGTNCVFYFGDGDSVNTCNFGNLPHTYPATGTYTAMMVVTNAQGCADTFYLTVIVEQETMIYLPNAFTPNSNGLNESFLAYGTNVDDFNMMIFDRWGNLLFESDDISKGWDGTSHSQFCQQDVYAWRITYADKRGKKYQRVGHVTLIR